MSFDSLDAFVAELQRHGELVQISAEVDPYLEISEITNRVVKAGGPALLFTNVRGSDVRVLTNQFGSERRMAMVFDAQNLDEVASRLRRLLDFSVPESLASKIAKLASLAPLASAVPKTVNGGSCQNVVIENPDLNALPVLTTWPLDAGPFITLGLVITSDPQTHVQNTGVYRMQIFDSTTAGMHWQRHK
ncbi:MAG: UbiD family decarboxylase domain-containing protein, partial [Vulcanimicrobiaceae bacterium]